MITRSFEEELQATGKLVCPNQGTSMLPLIRQGKDLMVIVPRPDRRLKKYEAVLFRRNGSYILHRITAVCDDEYVIRGDNRKDSERVREDQIIGVLYAVLRDGKKEIRANGLICRCFVLYWYILRPALKKVKRAIKILSGS